MCVCVCVCSLNYLAYKAHAPCFIVTWPVPFYLTVPHYLMNFTIFGTEVIEHTVHV